MTNYFFTADEHYGHKNIIDYCNRPFSSIEEMDEELIARHNEIVGPNDIVIHVGDFTLMDQERSVHADYIRKLVGQHIFLQGSHDYWLRQDIGAETIWEKKINGQCIIC